MELLDINSIIAFQFFDAHAFFKWYCENATYIFVFLFMIIESSFIPFPSELVIPPAAYLAVTQHDMNLFGVIAVGTAGALVGALFNYYMALWLGRPIIYKFADSRIGRACLITPEKVDKAEKYFDDHGAFSTFVGRLIPVIRQLISIPAGLARMSISKFILYTTLGALLWNIILGALGYFLGKTVSFEVLEEQIEHYNTYLSWAGFAILIFVVAWLTFKAFSKKTHSKS